MCGIIGYLGKRDAAPIIVEGLRRLEYRGYDSAGVATIDHGDLHRRRAVGKLSALVELLESDPITGAIGIGHTRWATHGAPTIANAHPHATERASVVHNGIIENFRELREELEAAGRVFETETDTETIVQLLSHLLDRGLSPFDAAKATLSRLEGAFALCMLFKGADELIIAARKGSPLAIGYGQGEMFVGSDALALAPLTQRICYLEEGDFASITRDGAQIFAEDGRPVKREVSSVSLSNASTDKGDYRHFMAKEMHEQPAVARNMIASYLSSDSKRVVAPVELLDLAKIKRLTMVACGTAYYACAIAKYWIESLTGTPVEIDIASEFRYRNPPLAGADAAVFVSQSGETADTLAALRHARAAGLPTISIVNVPTSTISRESDMVLPTLAGPEIGVASTKAFTCQLMVLASLAMLMARAQGKADAEQEAAFARSFSDLPDMMSQMLDLELSVASIAAEVAQHRDVLYLGRGAMYPLALEGALKLKEISYIHAEGHASGELKHGPIALIDKNVPVVVLAPKDALFEKTVSNMQEVMARGGKVVLLSDVAGVQFAGDRVWRKLALPDCDPMMAPILYALPVQLLAYHAALSKGTDVDQPRNLAKSVTVE